MKNQKMQMVNKEEVKKAEIIVGIPSYNEADNIDFVTKQVDLGLKKFFPKKESVIINVDNNSPDGTKDVFLQTRTKTPKLYITTPKNVKGKGNNFYNLFKATKKLKAKYVVVVDADLKSIEPFWIQNFINCMEAGREYVTPIYARNEYDGSITNSICYPLIYGLLGRDIRQPIGGDFAFKASLAEYWLKGKWLKSTQHYGIDIFMTTEAIFGGFKIGQVSLGSKIHKPSAPKLGPMFNQVVGTLYGSLSYNKKKWQNIQKIQEATTCGISDNGKAQDLPVDYKGTKETARYMYSINKQYYEKYLTPEVDKKLQVAFSKEILSISIELWFKIIMDSFYSCDIARASRHDVAGSLLPLFFARFVSFYKKTLELSHEDSERVIRNQATYFWRNRDYLLDRYKK